jgi:hypothetical protein
MAENSVLILKVLMLGMCILVVAAATVSGSDTKRSQSSRGPLTPLPAGDDPDSVGPGAFSVKALDWSAGPAAVWFTPPISPPNLEERNQLARQFLAERLAIWKQRMKLEDWRISIVLARHKASTPGQSGTISWNRATRSAKVSVLDASHYYLPCDEMLTQMEGTLVHELVRLALASAPRSEAHLAHEEYSINRLTETLISLDRQS